ncbi:hypothetical protein UT300018_12410 [Clostridium faecium]
MNPKSITANSTKSISIEITTCCPLKCVYCERKIQNKTLTYEEFVKLKELIDAQKSIERITFCGIGEAFLHQDIYKMINDLKDYKITIITSGTLLIDFQKLSTHKNVDIIIFSIDSISKEKIMDICGQNYNYDNLITNLNNLKLYNKKALKEHKFINSIINCTISKENIEAIPSIIDFAAKYKFCSVHYSLPWGNFKLAEDQYSTLKEQFFIAKKKSIKYNIYMEDPFNSFCCITHDHIMPYIDVNGNYYYCAYSLNRKEPLGNIKITSIETLRDLPICKEYMSGKLYDECYMTEFSTLDKKVKL